MKYKETFGFTKFAVSINIFYCSMIVATQWAEIWVKCSLTLLKSSSFSKKENKNLKSVVSVLTSASWYSGITGTKWQSKSVTLSNENIIWYVYLSSSRTGVFETKKMDISHSNLDLFCKLYYHEKVHGMCQCMSKKSVQHS